MPSKNIEHVRLLIHQYRICLDDASKAYDDLESKARWLLVVILPLGVALVGYMYSKKGSLGCEELVGLTSLLGAIGISGICAAVSLLLRNYKTSGIIPKDISSNKWERFLCGSKAEEVALSLAILKGLVEVRSVNQKSNEQKSFYLKLGIILATSALPISAVSWGIALLAC